LLTSLLFCLKGDGAVGGGEAADEADAKRGEEAHQGKIHFVRVFFYLLSGGVFKSLTNFLFCLDSE
jgi:hypothetical protein